jgi:hypothetical protein
MFRKAGQKKFQTLPGLRFPHQLHGQMKLTDDENRQIFLKMGRGFALCRWDSATS